MLKHERISRFLWASLILGLAVIVLPFRMHADELEQHLHSQYDDKILVLRGFYKGGNLTYDSVGTLTGSAAPGDWTLSGFVQVTSLRLSSQRLTIPAYRLSMLNDGHAFGFQVDGKGKAKKAGQLRVEVDLDPHGMTAENVDAILSKIFLTPQDRFLDLVPDYWRACILAASNGGERGKYGACSFQPEVAAVPGVVSGSTADKAAEAEAIRNLEVVPSRVGVIPPRPRLTPDPDFSGEARKLKYQGVITLMIVVDKSGHVRNIRIVRPLGMGLDQKAAETVAKWQFTPGSRGGEPADVEMAVQVDFRLY